LHLEKYNLLWNKFTLLLYGWTFRHTYFTISTYKNQLFDTFLMSREKYHSQWVGTLTTNENLPFTCQLTHWQLINNIPRAYMWIQKLTPFAVIYLSYLYVDIVCMYIANWAAFIATIKIYTHRVTFRRFLCD